MFHMSLHKPVYTLPNNNTASTEPMPPLDIKLYQKLMTDQHSGLMEDLVVGYLEVSLERRGSVTSQPMPHPTMRGSPHLSIEPLPIYFWTFKPCSHGDCERMSEVFTQDSCVYPSGVASVQLA